MLRSLPIYCCCITLFEFPVVWRVLLCTSLDSIYLNIEQLSCQTKTKRTAPYMSNAYACVCVCAFLSVHNLCNVHDMQLFSPKHTAFMAADFQDLPIHTHARANTNTSVSETTSPSLAGRVHATPLPVPPCVHISYSPYRTHVFCHTS